MPAAFQPGGTKKTAPQLLDDYLASIQDPQAAAALFADDGVIELPYIGARPGA